MTIDGRIASFHFEIAFSIANRDLRTETKKNIVTHVHIAALTNHGNNSAVFFFVIFVPLQLHYCIQFLQFALII